MGIALIRKYQNISSGIVSAEPIWDISDNKYAGSSYAITGGPNLTIRTDNYTFDAETFSTLDAILVITSSRTEKGSAPSSTVNVNCRWIPLVLTNSGASTNDATGTNTGQIEGIILNRVLNDTEFSTYPRFSGNSYLFNSIYLQMNAHCNGVGSLYMYLYWTLQIYAILK